VNFWFFIETDLRTIETHLAANGLVPSMEDPVKAFSYAPADAPFGFAFNTEKDVFGWLMEPGHERALEDCSSGVNWLNVRDPPLSTLILRASPSVP
jgi:hypothetical protein